MSKQDRYDQLYMDIAYRYSQMSFDPDRQVGCVIVKDDAIISTGFNGMPKGFDNECKHHTGATKDEVIHAESNAIAKLARSTNSSEGATAYCTLAPCMDCAKIMLQAGITTLVFSDDWKDDKGKILLMKSDVEIRNVKYAKPTTLSEGEGS